MKKSLFLVVAAAVGVVVALLRLFPEWARRVAGLLRPVTDVVNPVSRLGQRARSTVPGSAAEAPGAATDVLRPDVT